MRPNLRFLFLHGGPWLNGFAERAILGPVIGTAGHEAYFWNEPSRLRPDGDAFEPSNAYAHWFASAERALLSYATRGPVYLTAHSFTFHAAVEIARRHPHSLRGLVIVSPAADPLAAYKNVLRLCQREASTPQLASGIAESVEHTRSVLDDAMRQGFELVLQEPALVGRIFTHYWADAEQFLASVAAQSLRGGQFDVDSFFAVLADFGGRGTSHLSRSEISIPSVTVFGGLDPITRQSEQDPALRHEIPHVKVHVFDDCGHYVHLDRPQRFLDCVVEWANGNPG